MSARCGGLFWAEPEMVYEEPKPVLETVSKPLTRELLEDISKEMARAAGQPGPSSVKLATAGGAQLDMVMNRELRAVVNAGLAGAFVQLMGPVIKMRPWNWWVRK